MYNWDNIEACAATGGVSDRKWQGGNIVIDSRKISKNDIFLALKGVHADGHDYVNKAFDMGAAAAIVSEDVIANGALLKVNDCNKAIQDLAIYRRNQFKGKVIAVTGSSGKTTTKEQLRLCFAALGDTYASKGNFNNELGLPISVANLDIQAEYGVFEMGMNHAGEIARLTAIARPDIAIITNIGTAHIEFFQSRQGIADAKAEIFQGVTIGGAAIINIDCEYGEYLISLAKKENITKIITYGFNENANCRIVSYEEGDGSCYIVANIMGVVINYSMKSEGSYFALNSIASLAAVYANGGDVVKSAIALADFGALAGRGQKHLIEMNGKKFELIDDSYNANPGSVSASLNALGKSKSRKIAILADMKELGEHSRNGHESLKKDIEDLDILLIAIGPMMRYLYDALDSKYRLAYYEDVNGLAEDIENYLKNGDLVLIKGSNSMGLSKLVDQIINQGK